MPIQVRCPNPACSHSYSVTSEQLPAKGRCKRCGHVFRLSGSVEGAPGIGSGPARSVSRDSSIPERIGRFQVLNRLGAGAFGTVYRAFDPSLDREVALKVPQTALLDSPKAKERFLREARAAARLRHPRIVPLFEAGFDQDRHYIASAFIEGTTLADLVEPGGVGWDRAARIALQLAEALHYAHSEKIVHRDVKPSNVMIDVKGDAHLMDFGLARFELSEERLTQDGAILGTPAYMAPEQATGRSGEANALSDQYSLGATLYELLCGRPPFSGPPEVVLFLVTQREPDRPRAVNPGVPRDLETICLKAMAKAPADRYADCGDLADDLRRWLMDESIRARRQTVPERARRWVRKNAMVAGLTVAVVLSLAVGTVATSFLAIRASMLARQSAELARRSDRLARQADRDAREARTQADRAILAERQIADEVDRARVARRQAQREAADSTLQRAIGLCEAGEVGHGLLWLARGHGLARDAGDLALEEAYRWNIQAWQERHPLLERILVHPANVESAAFSVDGSKIFTGGADGKLRIWDVATGAELENPMSHPAGLVGLGVVPNGDLVITTCRDEHIRIWDWARRAEVQSIAMKGAGNLAIDPRGGRFLVGSWEGAFLFSIETGLQIKALKGRPDDKPYAIEAVAFYPDGSPVTVNNATQGMVWDGATLQQSSTSFPTAVKGIRTLSVAVSPDGKVLATGQLFDHTVRFLDAHSKQRLGSGRHSATVQRLSFHPDGTMLASGSDDTTVRLWDVPSFELAAPHLLHGGPVRVCQFDPSGERLITGGPSGQVKLWRLRPRQPFRSIASKENLNALAFSPGGSKLASSSLTEDGVRIHDVATGELLVHAPSRTGWALIGDFLPDGKSAIVAINGAPGVSNRLYRWDLHGDLRAQEIAQESEEIWRLTLSGDGRRVAFGCLGSHGHILPLEPGEKASPRCATPRTCSGWPSIPRAGAS